MFNENVLRKTEYPTINAGSYIGKLKKIENKTFKDKQDGSDYEILIFTFAEFLGLALPDFSISSFCSPTLSPRGNLYKLIHSMDPLVTEAAFSNGAAFKEHVLTLINRSFLVNIVRDKKDDGSDRNKIASVSALPAGMSFGHPIPTIVPVNAPEQQDLSLLKDVGTYEYSMMRMTPEQRIIATQLVILKGGYADEEGNTLFSPVEIEKLQPVFVRLNPTPFKRPVVTQEFDEDIIPNWMDEKTSI